MHLSPVSAATRRVPRHPSHQLTPILGAAKTFTIVSHGQILVSGLSRLPSPMNIPVADCACDSRTQRALMFGPAVRGRGDFRDLAPGEPLSSGTEDWIANQKLLPRRTPVVRPFGSGLNWCVFVLATQLFVWGITWSDYALLSYQQKKKIKSFQSGEKDSSQ